MFWARSTPPLLTIFFQAFAEQNDRNQTRQQIINHGLRTSSRTRNRRQQWLDWRLRGTHEEMDSSQGHQETLGWRSLERDGRVAWRGEQQQSRIQPQACCQAADQDRGNDFQHQEQSFLEEQQLNDARVHIYNLYASEDENFNLF